VYISPFFFLLPLSLCFVMYVLSPSQIPYAYFPDAFIYVPLLIENLLFEVILIDVCHFDQGVAHRCFVRTILHVSLSPSIFLLTFCDVW